MNWDAIGAVGEIVGAAAVVISVVYLALQIRKQTEESRLSASRELAAQYGEALDRLTENTEFTEIYLTACQNYNDLPKKERLWASIVFQRFCRVMEQQHLHIENSNINPKYFDSMHVAWREWLTFPGAQQWWDASKTVFGADFQAHVDDLMVEAKRKGYDSSFKDS